MAPKKDYAARFWENDGPVAPSDLLERLAAAPAMLGMHERLLLYALVRAFSPHVSVEIGTMWGGSAQIITMALQQIGAGHLWCIDPAPELRIDWSQIENFATMVRAPSPAAFDTVARQIPAPIDFAFIDGIHEYDAVVADTMALVPHLSGTACLLYHDAMHHEVSKAIDHCIAEVPQLSNGGPVSRYFTTSFWPVGAYGGLRMVHFHDPNQPSWLPAWMKERPRTTSLRPLSEPAAQAARSELRRLVDRKQTPIALYGAGQRLAAMTEILAEFAPHIVVILDDDPMLEGSRKLGWTVTSPQQAVAWDVKSVFVTVMNREVVAEGLAELAKQGLEIAFPEPEQWRIVEMPLTDPLATMDQTLHQQFFAHRARRFALYGAGKFTRRFGAWLSHKLPFVEVVAIVDDDPALQGGRLWGIPIVAPERVGELEPDCVVISSPSREEEIWSRRSVIEAQGIRVARGFKPAPTTP